MVTSIGLPICHGRDGLVVEPENPSALASAIESLIEDGVLRRTLQEGAKRYIEESHSLDKMARIYVDQFKNIG